MIMALPRKKPSMLRCSGCGTTQEAACDCGVGYIPAGVFTSMAVADPKNRGKSDVLLAEELGVSDTTVWRARKAGSSFEEPAKRIGRDGRLQSATKKLDTESGKEETNDRRMIPFQGDIVKLAVRRVYDFAKGYEKEMNAKQRREFRAKIIERFQND